MAATSLAQHIGVVLVCRALEVPKATFVPQARLSVHSTPPFRLISHWARLGMVKQFAADIGSASRVAATGGAPAMEDRPMARGLLLAVVIDALMLLAGKANAAGDRKPDRCAPDGRCRYPRRYRRKFTPPTDTSPAVCSPCRRIEDASAETGP